MKHYIYISSTKVEMLFSQIPQNIKSRIATEIKIDLKIFSTTFKDKDANPDTNLYSKLDMVLQHIEADANVGTVACPKSYFRNSRFFGNSRDNGQLEAIPILVAG